MSTVIISIIFMTLTSAHGYQSCQDYFNRENSCPHTDLNIYKQINSLCCNADITTKLHCLSTHTRHPSGQSTAYWRCLPQTVITRGNAMTFEPWDSSESVKPVPCTGRYYEPYDRNSIDVRQDYCTHEKVDCSDHGATLVCLGGPAADDQCGCGDGREPDGGPECWKGFYCQCKNKTCPSGTARNMTAFFQGNCSGKSMEIDYACHPLPSTSPAPAQTSPTSQANAQKQPRWLWLLSVLLASLCYTVLY